MKMLEYLTVIEMDKYTPFLLGFENSRQIYNVYVHTNNQKWKPDHNKNLKQLNKNLFEVILYITIVHTYNTNKLDI